MIGVPARLARVDRGDRMLRCAAAREHLLLNKWENAAKERPLLDVRFVYRYTCFLDLLFSEFFDEALLEDDTSG